MATERGGTVREAVSALLERLESVKEAGTDRWLAKCPAHPDKSPSLSIRKADDRLLIHCFAGCTVGDIFESVGLSGSDLFDKPPERIGPARDSRHLHAAAAALKTLSEDALLVAIAAENVAQGTQLTDQDRASLREAARRIRDARRVAA